ncbi:MAG: hypothetical protein D4R79_02445 [Comamonadaceae bacterium]|nr:MAG: hypothetical protein D4R79_02445 [Comamonadaceae bacterium]
MHEIRRPSRFDRSKPVGRFLHWFTGLFFDDGAATLPWRIFRSSALCVVYYWLFKDLFGPAVWLFLAFLAAPLFKRIVVDLLAELGWQIRRATLEPLHGSFYQFQNFQLQVVEDDDHCRWIPTEKVRQIVGQLASDEALAKLFPSGLQRLGDEQKGYLRDDALMAHLAGAHSSQGIKFKNWIERNVAFPARKIRERKRVVIRAATAARDD